MRRMPRKIQSVAVLIAAVIFAEAKAEVNLAQAQTRPTPAARRNRGPFYEATPLPSRESIRQEVRQEAKKNAAPPSLSLDLRSEPDGTFVSMADFLKVVSSIDASARGQWDEIIGVLRVQSREHNLQAFSQKPVVVIEGKYRSVAKALRVKGTEVLIPVETAKLLLHSLNFDLEIPESAAASATPPPTPGPSATAAPTPEETAMAASSTPAPSTPTPTPEPPRETPPPISPEVRAALPERPSGLFPEDLDPGRRARPDSGEFSSASEVARPSIDVPPLSPTVAGLTWNQLADELHRTPPERVTIVCDPALSALAEKLERSLMESSEILPTVISVQTRRDSPELLALIARSQPQLVLDLGSAGGNGNDSGTPEDAALEIWAVHDALWPEEAKGGTQGARDVRQLYKAHQFQNLAFASTLRGELALFFPERTVRYELSPSYLLRRIDAPSAALLVPADLIPREETIERLAKPIAAGILAYRQGIESAIAH